MPANLGYREITIEYDAATHKIGVEPPTASLYWVAGPDSARWRRKDGMGASWEFDIEFENGRSPLREIVSSIGPAGYEVTGTDNTKQPGLYKYTVIIRRSDGVVLDRLDPMLENEPNPDP